MGLLAEIVTDWIDSGKATAMADWKRSEIAARYATAREILGPWLEASLEPCFHLWISLPDPWRTETFKFSTDPELEAKVRDVVGLYLNPPDKAVVLCVDEKSQVQALDRTAPILPIMPGVPEKQTHDYVGTEFAGWFSFQPLWAKITREQPDLFD